MSKPAFDPDVDDRPSFMERLFPWKQRVSKKPLYQLGVGRDLILDTIADQLGRGPLQPAARAALAERISRAPRHPRPALPGDLAEVFTQRITRRAATVQTLADIGDVPAAVAAHLRTHCLPTHIAVSDPLAALAWPAPLQVHTGAAQRNEAVAVSLARLAVAETGSVLLGSGSDTPTTHNFVPDDHLVVLHRQDIVAHLEDAWTSLRNHGGMPRAVNLIAGPSRTGDIEQTIQLGAHGPRRLHILLIG